MEPQWRRVILFIFISFLCPLFGDYKFITAYSMMATGLTVLTGFTFTALFSDQSLGAAGLPKPQNETDRFDLERLSVLSDNFRSRSSYFISISILCVILLTIGCIEFEIPEIIRRSTGDILLIIPNYKDIVLITLRILSRIIYFLFYSIIFFVYLECIYTFYRMAETILAIVDTRRNYLGGNAKEMS